MVICSVNGLWGSVSGEIFFGEVLAVLLVAATWEANFSQFTEPTAVCESDQTPEPGNSLSHFLCL